ncbi:MAG: DUF1018 domain-containing protein [Gammaproteobacteria bacterium]|nr:DUF1018 domain-containing protein [Gammaproteobacteria bacterium]
MNSRNKPRNNHLAQIHILKKELALDDDTYQDVLFTVARVRSSKDLDEYGRKKVIQHMRSLKGKSSYPGRPHNCDENPQLQKIEALLAENKKSWAYADGIAKRMYQKDRVAFCDGQQLTGIITALIRQFGQDPAYRSR